MSGTKRLKKGFRLAGSGHLGYTFFSLFFYLDIIYILLTYNIKHNDAGLIN